MNEMRSVTYLRPPKRMNVCYYLYEGTLTKGFTLLPSCVNRVGGWINVYQQVQGIAT